jgi:uncharacterized membrane protein
MLARHWLMIANALAWAFALLPLLAPAFMAAGLAALADPIYQAYSLVCHQWAHRSFFLFGPQATYTWAELASWTHGTMDLAYIGSPESGYKVAFCERDVAIYLSIALAGSVYGMHRAGISPLPLWLYLAMLVPIAVDGFTQLFGWRESTPLLRLLTGMCFGVGTVWFIYPRLDELRDRLQQKRQLGWRPAAA